MQRYHLDAEKLASALKKNGFAHLTQFTRKMDFNRMTLHHYLKGKGPLLDTYYELCQALKTDPLELLSPLLPKNKVADDSRIKTVCENTLKAYPQIAIGLFGSRAKGCHKKFSDWDLGITRGVNPLATKDYFRLKDLIEELADDLPYLIDVIRLDQVPDWFLEKIDYEPLFLGGNEIAWAYFQGILHGVQRKKQTQKLSQTTQRSR